MSEQRRTLRLRRASAGPQEGALTIDAIVRLVEERVTAATTPLLQRIADLEKEAKIHKNRFVVLRLAAITANLTDGPTVGKLNELVSGIMSATSGEAAEAIRPYDEREFVLPTTAATVASGRDQYTRRILERARQQATEDEILEALSEVSGNGEDEFIIE